MSDIDAALASLAYLLICATLVGWVTFRLFYTPLRPSKHSRIGRHLIRTADSMIALTGVSIIMQVIPLPLTLSLVVSVFVLVWLVWVAWERVLILRREKRQAPSTHPKEEVK